MSFSTSLLATLAFSITALGLVLLAGRKDAARDPRLTLSMLIFMAAVPVLSAFAPKVGIFPASLTSSFPWHKWLSAVWFSGAALFLLRLGIAARALSHLNRNSYKLDEIEGVEICANPRVHSPLAVGVIHQRILVPVSWLTWKKHDQKIVLSHELFHHRRRDPLWIICAEMSRVILWWHPLAHWLIARFKLQCEYTCDEAVVREGIDPNNYSLLLCEIAEKQTPQHLSMAMADYSSLHLRIARIVKPATHFSPISLVPLVIVGAACACGLSMIGTRLDRISEKEVSLRLTANPFPDEH